MTLNTVKKGSLEYLTSPSIGVRHGFTTRLGGISQGYLSSMNLGTHRGDTLETVERNYAIMGQALGFSVDDLVLTWQTHSDIVRVVGREDAGLGVDHRSYPQCDALVTNTAGLALMVFTADCTPILFWDPVTGAVGAAHAGWRGTAAQIAKKTVQTMTAAFGCKPENIHAAIGPNIGECCFETDADVPQAMVAALGDPVQEHIRQAGHKYYVNLKEINALILRQSGVQNIVISQSCTACEPDRFWSHRKMGANRGSQGAIIVCKEGTA